LPIFGRKREISRKGWPSHEARNPKIVDSEEKMQNKANYKIGNMAQALL
jgi:hypothetical protein